MNYTIACPTCSKRYTVPDTVSGKRVKCTECGDTFVAPKPGDADQGTDLAALEALEPAPMNTPPPTAPPPPRRPESAAPVFSSGGISIEGLLPQPPPIRNKRRGRGSGPIDDLIHDKLPLALILIGIVLPMVILFVLTVRYAPSPGAICQLFLLIGGYVCITIPLTVVGLRIAAHLLDFELVESPGFRIVAAFAASWIVLFFYIVFNPPPISLHGQIGIALAGDIAWLLIGLLISISASLGLVKLFFFLTPGQAFTTWLISSVSYLIGNVVTLFLTGLILWLGSMIFSTGSSPAPSNTSGNSAPAPVARDETKETASKGNLATISLYMKQYYAANGKYPAALEALVTDQSMPAETLHSPFGNGTGDDYAYAQYPVPGEWAIHDWILVYDQAEKPIEDGAVILRGTGETDFMDTNVLSFALDNGQKTAQGLLAEKNAQTPPAVSVANPPPIAPLPPTQPAPNNPIEPRNTGPAWAATVDAPFDTPAINVHLREVFNGADDLYFSQNGGAWLIVNPQPTAPTASFRNPANAELWNLKTLLRAGRYPAIPPMHDAILSPGGTYLVGRTIGGDPDVAVAFEIWSARTGKRLHTVATDPITTGAIPRPIGFPDSGQVLTAGDKFDLWDLNTGSRIREFADQLTMDSKTLIAPSPNCKLAAVLAGDDSGVWLVSATTGKTLGEARIYDKPQGTGDGRGIQFSPDGQQIAALVGGQWIYVWSAATGKQLGMFNIDKPISGGADANTLIWMPDGQSWLVGGDRIIDSQIGECVFPLPPVVEQGGQEFGQRRVIDNAHIVAQFHTTAGDKTALESLPIDSSFVNTRAVLRADRQAMKNAEQ